MKIFKKLLIVVFCFLLTVGVAGAVPINSPSDIDSPKTVIDFESFPLYTGLPINEGGASISADGGAVVTNAYSPITPYVSGQYVGYGPYSFTITFSNAVSQFGLGVFDPQYDHNQLVAYDVHGTTLESMYLPYGGLTSIFAGFKRAQADIAKIQLINDWSYPGGNPDSIGIDNITFSRVTTAPIPGACWLLGSGLLGLVGLRRKFKV